MKPSEILRKAQQVISTPDKWTKGAYARNSAGEDLPSCDERAVCFCSIGAINRSMDWGPEGQTALTFLDYSAESLVAMHYNDLPDTTHEDIMLMFDAAIGIAEAEGQ